MAVADIRLKIVRSYVHDEELIGQNDLAVHGNIAHCGERVVCGTESLDLRYCD